MPIIITYQKDSNSLNAAYRPIVYRCKSNISGATATDYIPPVVYCDVYINDVYYKSLSKTQYINNNGIQPEYEFDIQDVLQEVMSYNLPSIDGSAVQEFSNTIKKVSIKFRNAKFDSDGFITSEQTAPIQGTSSNLPISGDGVSSNEIYVYNSTIQHEDVQNFEVFLNNYKTGIWDANSFPLTRRPKKMKLCKNDSSYFPIASNKEVRCIELVYRNKGENTFQTTQYCYSVEKSLVIVNLENTTGTNYNISFTSNFNLTSLYFEVSTDSINWSSPILLSGITSPQTISITLTGSFFIRIYDDNSLIRKHNSKFNSKFN